MTAGDDGLVRCDQLVVPAPLSFPPGSVIPAKAGIFDLGSDTVTGKIPAFAGMTGVWDDKGYGMTADVA
jgi:hypothetical protein